MNRNLLLNDLLTELENQYPLELAESWDKVGLHFGSRKNSINKVLVALDIRPQVVEEAINEQVDTIIVHHPPIFDPIERFDLDIPMIETFSLLIKNNINVYAMHTNFDIAYNGMNDWLAESLGLVNISSCQSDNEGQPGLGRVGNLSHAIDRDTLIKHVKTCLSTNHLTIIEKNPKKSYQKVAVIGGAGLSLIDTIAQEEPDVFITGDITYHNGHTAEDFPFMTIDAGHYIEAIFIPKMSHHLSAIAKNKAWPITVIPSQVTTNPFKFE